MRIFLDAKILFSASLSDGAVRALVHSLLADDHVLVADEYVLEEARRNLAAKSRDGTRELIRMAARLEIAAFQAEIPSIVPSSLPEKDRPVLAAALRARCDVLVTGDRAHFGALYGRTIGGVTIHSPASLAGAL